MNRGMRRMVVAAALAAVAPAVCLPATAEAADRDTLLHRYQPVTVLDDLEQFAPTTVG